ncbi:MAG: AAA family ATPase [Conexivisphaerales archaeon]
MNADGRAVAKSRRIGLTGSPKTGKTEIGRGLAKALNLPFYDLNSICITKRLGRFQGDEFVVDVKRARDTISSILKGKSGYVVSGLLLPDLVKSTLLDSVIVLRCNPKVLFSRYMQSGYSMEKAKENVVSEAIGVVYSEALDTFGRKVIQLDITSMSLDDAVEAIVKGDFKKQEIDWLSEAEKDESLLRLLL